MQVICRVSLFGSYRFPSQKIWTQSNAGVNYYAMQSSIEHPSDTSLVPWQTWLVWLWRKRTTSLLPHCSLVNSFLQHHHHQHNCHHRICHHHTRHHHWSHHHHEDQSVQILRSIIGHNRRKRKTGKLLAPSSLADWFLISSSSSSFPPHHHYQFIHHELKSKRIY